MKADLESLLDHNIAVPGTLLSRNGLIPTCISNPAVKPDAAILNRVLREGMAQEIINKVKAAQHQDHSLRLTSCSMNDAFIHAITEGSLKEHLNGIEETDEALQALMTAARRMRSTYERNFSPFALDLVGAVIRQGVFVEKMQYYDWVKSPAVGHTVSCAVERYAGFFAVMNDNLGKTAVPTFDVDLVWHTQQLSPSQYYKYSLENCNQNFIDHDDKIVENVLNNSFEWTCNEFARLTGTIYDKCLCWCCAILEQDSMASKSRGGNESLKSRFKTMLKSVRREDEVTDAEGLVIDIQARKFEKEYANEVQKATNASKKPLSKKQFFGSYVWHYPKFAPHPEEVGAA